MKITLPFLLTGCLALTALGLLAQDEPVTSGKNYRNVIKSNPFYTLAGWVPMTYERFIGRSTSVVIGASYITNEPPIFSDINKTYQTREGYYINPAIRFYLFKTQDSPGGFYASPEIGFISQTKRLGADSAIVYRDPIGPKDTLPYSVEHYPAEKLVVNELQIGATIGYQWVIKQAFVLDVYAGEAIGLLSFNGNEQRFYEHLNNAGHSNRSVPINGARLLAGVKVGIAF